MQLSEEDTQLTVAVCRVFGRLQQQIVFGDAKERHKAAKRLRRITAAFIPETRGKKKVTVHPLEVKGVYFRELFRLYHVQNSLKSPAGGRSRSQKVRAISKNFDITIELIRELWKLDEDDKPTVRPIPIKEMARVLTARYFGMTQHRISNILAS